jgi:hypothetical protein
MHKIEFDDDLALMTLTLTGYWTMEEFGAYEAAFLAVLQDIRKRHRDFRILSRSAEFPVQSVEVATAFGERIWGAVKDNRGPVALIAGSVLNKMQAERVFPDPNVRVFLSEEEARAWLFRDGALPQ